MTECYIYDHVRTPRGRGKSDGSLHEVTALELATQALEAVRDRNELDTSSLDDVVFGCVDPVMEAGGDVARASIFEAGYATEAPGMQINRFCASGLDAVNMGAAKIGQGADDIVITGGVESMSRVGLGMSGGAWFMDPSVNMPSYFMPQGVSADLIATKYGFSRDDVDAYAVESQKRAAHAWENGYFQERGHRYQRRQNGIDHPRSRRAHAAGHGHAVAWHRSMPRVRPSSATMGGFNAVAVPGAIPDVEYDQPRAPCRQLVRHCRRRRRRADGHLPKAGKKHGDQAHGPENQAPFPTSVPIRPSIMLTGPVDGHRASCSSAAGMEP